MRAPALVALVMIATAVALSLLWQIPYIFSVIGFATWAFVGHLVTADDDLPGGWSNPDGRLPFLWGELGAKAAVLLVSCLLAALFPAVRRLGGAP